MLLTLVVAGPPAAGKTTLALALAHGLGAALIDLDTATAPLMSVIADLVGTDDLDDAKLARLVRDARYETVTALAEDVLRAGTAVVLVAPFTRERREVDTWSTLAARLTAAGGVPRLVWIDLNAPTLMSRLLSRGAKRDRAKVANLAAYVAGLDLAPPAVEYIWVRGEDSLLVQLSSVLAEL